MNARQQTIFSETGYCTLKDARKDGKYIKTLITHGNAKLVDYIPSRDGESDNLVNETAFTYGMNLKFAQFNLPALVTCPFKTPGCTKFCYAKRDERWPSIRYNRSNNLDISKESDFSERMIYTIKVELLSGHYKNSVMVVRIHESGEFYNRTYLKAWLIVFNYFRNSNVIFQFYTKSFDYFLSLDAESKQILIDGLNTHHIGASWSIDDTMHPIQKVKAFQLMKEFKNSNIYYATKNLTEGHQVCDCKHCAKCMKCILTDGNVTDCIIH